MAEKDLGRILLVDDEDAIREGLAEQFQRLGFEVVGQRSPHEALQLLSEDPAQFQFAFVDHRFDTLTYDRVDDIPDPDPLARVPWKDVGIELVRQFAGLNPNLTIIVYSAQVIPDDKVREALACGAKRYILQPKLVETFENEFKPAFEEILDLRSQLDQYHISWQQFGAALPILDVGVNLIDRQHKMWYRNEAYRQMVGHSEDSPDFCYCQSHRYPVEQGGCWGCIVDQAIDENVPIDHIFYSPVYPGGTETFKYMHVWVNPVHGKAGHAIAAVESVVDLTGSPTIIDMPLVAHLKLLAASIFERRFHTVRIYRSRKDHRTTYRETAILIEGAEYVAEQQAKGSRIAFHDELIARDSRSVKLDDLDCTWQPRSVGTRKEPSADHMDLPDQSLSITGQASAGVLRFALYGPNGKHIGWIEAESAPCHLDVLDSRKVLQPYATEIARVLATKGDDRLKAPADDTVERLRIRLGAMMPSPELVSTALHALVDEFEEALPEDPCGEDSIMAHIRVVDGDICRLIDGVGRYAQVAQKERRMDDPALATSSVIHTGQSLVTNDIGGDSVSQKKLVALAQEEREILEDMSSHAIVPLVFGGCPIGALCVYARPKDFFVDRIDLLHDVGRLLGPIVYASWGVMRAQRQAENIAALASFAGRAGAGSVWIHRAAQKLSAANSLIVRGRRYAERLEDAKLLDMFAELERLNLEAQAEREPDDPGTFTASIGDLVAMVIEQFRDTRPAARVEFKSIRSLVQVEAPPYWVRHALQILLDNAAHAVRRAPSSGCVRVRIQVELSRVAVHVRDTGPGVPSDIASRLFRAPVPSDKGGRGVGLLVSRGIALSYGGNVQMLSGNAGETEFVLYLPIRE